MATTPYEDALHAVERLTSEERQRLQDTLAELQTRDTTAPSSEQPSGAALVGLLDAQPSDPAIWEEIGQMIEDACECIDPSTW